MKVGKDFFTLDHLHFSLFNGEKLILRKEDFKMSAILIKVIRGGHEESLYRGSIAVVDNRGNLIDHLGDPDFSTFLCSCNIY